MKKQLLLFLFLLGFAFSNAQINLTPTPTTIAGEASETDINVELELSLDGVDSLDVYWKLVKDKFPLNWISYVCDNVSCYGFNIDEAGLPNKMYKDNVYKWSIHLNPNNDVGENTPMFELYTDQAFTDLITAIPVSMIVGPTGVEDNVDISGIQLFPNPATEYFQVLDDANVEKIAIYNIVGKKMKEESHTIGQTHDVDEFQSGMYIVRLLDRNNNMIKAIRMTKK